MLEITPEDIAQLNDEQLRELIGLLCESELRRKGHSPAAVTYGGNQNAADGGLDVVVALPPGTEISGFIPRSLTGYQVKRQDMPAAAIAAEMAPNDAPRKSISELADAGGAYVIVSSDGSTAHSALVRRRNAMASAIKSLPNARALALDFYDRTRVSTWVRDNPSSILWVRKTVGRPVRGWERYGPWSYPAGGLSTEYLADQGVTIRPRPARPNPNADLSTNDGIAAMREVLGKSGGVVRLVGLSGVGKTRFAQALFDERIGTNALDQSLVFYTDMNCGPDPQPGSLASDLVASGTRAVVVVDNCAPELHGRLAEIAKAQASRLSVMTIEYDIREDQPEGTEVYEVRSASVALIEALLRDRYRNISQIDARRAAEFSGGNARIGIALAETVTRGGSLQHLNDNQLFERLFVQRQDRDQRLLAIAQGLSLVYSFNGEDVSDDSELARIGNMIGATADDGYRAVAELLRRDLAQHRGPWRAILPHAIANRLAVHALQNIPRPRIETSLADNAPIRIQKSFSRRLGFLHESIEAQTLVADWFSPTGRLSSVWDLNDFGETLFENVLPVTPEAGLAAIERSLPAYDQGHSLKARDYISRALRHLAYDPALFERATNVLQIIATNGESSCAKIASDVHASLFTVVLSGTHATIEQRVAAAARLLKSTHHGAQTLGLAAVDAMLKTSFISSSYDFQFGAHSRDYGYRARTIGELTHWYRSVLAFSVEIAESGEPPSEIVRSTIAAHFRGIWSQVRLWDELEDAARRLGANDQFWRDGWQAVKETRRFDAKDRESESYARLSILEVRLRPTGLVQEVRGRALGSRNVDFDVDDVDLDAGERYTRAMDKKRAEVEALGDTLASQSEAFLELLPELVEGPGQLWHLGAGLAKGAQDPRQLWDALVRQFAHAGEKGDTRILSGFVEHLKASNPALADDLLDETLTSDVLGLHFPRIQSSVGIDEWGIKRLFRSLELGRANIGSYYNLSIGRATDRIPGETLAQFIRGLAGRQDGGNVALQILHMQYFMDKQERRPHSLDLIIAGRELLASLDFSRSARRDDYELGGVISACLAGEGAYDAAKKVCQKLLAGVAGRATSGVEHNELLSALMRVQPVAALDTLLGGDGQDTHHGVYLLHGASQVQKNPMDQVPESVLLEWANRDSARFAILASVVSGFAVVDNKISGWTPISGVLVHGAPDPIPVLVRLIRGLDVVSWNGSQASALEANAKVLDLFDTRGSELLGGCVATHRARLLTEAQKARDWENERDRRRDESFE